MAVSVAQLREALEASLTAADAYLAAYAAQDPKLVGLTPEQIKAHLAKASECEAARAAFLRTIQVYQGLIDLAEPIIVAPPAAP